MQLHELTIENLDIPFKVSFQHSVAARAATEAVLVRAAANDVQGLGEGCPRSYVTGETLETTHAFFKAHRPDFMQIGTLDDLKSWIEIRSVEIDRNPAAFCAVELALLTALADEAGRSVEALLSLPELCGVFQYTAVLGVRKPQRFEAMLQQYLHLGFTDFKVKVFGDFETDKKNIAAIKSCDLDKIRVRIDANNLWSDPDAAIRYIKRLDIPVFAVEEPLGVQKYDDCRKLSEALGIKIILDESFTKVSCFERIVDDPNSWIINIRISKMGGILRSLSIAEKAKQAGIPVIIGAQVGETSILTRAALTIANVYRDNLLAQEGAFGTRLLERDLIEPPLMFGKGGILRAERI